MNFFFYSLLISGLVCLLNNQAYGEPGKAAKAVLNSQSTKELSSTSTKEVTVDNFRCEKFREGGISELKIKMLENCDLNRPYSTSLSLFAGEETILYCCHKK
jgi:hypothetical protein